MAPMPSSTLATARHVAVATPAASMTSLANAFEPSSWATSRVGPKAATPRAARRSTSPSTSGASGPTTTRSTPSAAAAAAIPATSPTATSSRRAWRAMPGLPGAHRTSGPCGERPSARTIACSRPPAPTTRTFTRRWRRSRDRSSEARDEVVDRDGRERLVADRSARAQLERHPRHRLLVGRLDDVDEVVAPERRPLRLDRRAELLDLLVDLADALRVVLDGLDPLSRERREHDVGGHGRVVSHRASGRVAPRRGQDVPGVHAPRQPREDAAQGLLALARSEEHTSELQSQFHLVCRLLLEKKKNTLRSHDRHMVGVAARPVRLL